MKASLKLTDDGRVVYNGRKSLHVRTVISHFVEIGEVLNIETWHKGRLLLLDSIASEVKCDKLAKKIIRPFQC